jgi:DNA-binding response OmpR family regulator
MDRILIIDDTASVLAALDYFLRSIGYDVALAGDGRKGLELAAAYAPDLVLLDLEMPLMNGVVVCRALKADAALARIPVAIMTGQATQEARRQALAAGAGVVMTKPFDLEVLQATIARSIASGREPAAALPPALTAAPPAEPA